MSAPNALPLPAFINHFVSFSPLVTCIVTPLSPLETTRRVFVDGPVTLSTDVRAVKPRVRHRAVRKVLFLLSRPFSSVFLMPRVSDVGGVTSQVCRVPGAASVMYVYIQRSLFHSFRQLVDRPRSG